MHKDVWGDDASIHDSSRTAARRGQVRVVNAIAGALLALGVVATLQAAMTPSGDVAPLRPTAFHGTQGGVVHLLAGSSTAAALTARPLNTQQPIVEADAAAANVAEVPAEASAAAQALREEAVRVSVEQWVASWSGRDVDGYLAAYSKEFAPDNGMARGDWEAQRRQRIGGRGPIYIALRDLEVELADDGQATVHFLQDYRTGRYQELATPKTLTLTMEDGAWRIVAEKSGS